MLRKLIGTVICAGLGGGVCLAVDVTGVYSGAGNGQNLTISLRNDGDLVRGQVAIGGGSVPLVGREANGMIQGIWRNSAGADVPFVAAVKDGAMQIQTNGVTYALSRDSAANQTPQADPLAARPANPLAGQAAPASIAQAPVADVAQLQVRQGKCLQFAVPQGWQTNDTTNGVDAASPDGITSMSHTFLRGVGRSSPDQCYEWTYRMLANYGVSNVRVVSVKEVGPNSKLWDLEYLCRGRPAHGMYQATVTPGPNGYFADMVSIQSSQEMFQQYMPTLVAMAKSVRVTDNGTFVDNAKQDASIMERNRIVADTQRQIGDIIINGERERSAVRDQMALRYSDTLRDVNRYTDSSGRQYTAPLNAVRAFKNADGTTSYSTNNYSPAPAGSTELNPYTYRAH